MPSTSQTVPWVDEQRLDRQFMDLVYGDPDLLAAEFDAIIAAQWSEPPTDRPDRGPAGGRSGRGEARRGADPHGGPVGRPRHPGMGGWARQRSPPIPDPRQLGRQVIATHLPARGGCSPRPHVPPPSV